LVSNLRGNWQAVLDFATMKKHREKLGVGSTPWTDVLAMMRSCLTDSGRVIVKHPAATSTAANLDADDDAAAASVPPSGSSDVSRRPLVVVLRYNVVDFDIESDFVLQPVLPSEDEEEGAAASAASSSAASSSSGYSLAAPQQLQAHLLFGVFGATASAEAAALAPLQSELSRLKRELQQVRNELASARHTIQSLETERASGGWGGNGGLGYVPGGAGSQHHSSYDDGSHSSGSGAAGAAAAGSSPAKRKVPAKPQNMSILNPNAKRRKVGAIKIGE
jgi:hypothetical protein